MIIKEFHIRSGCLKLGILSYETSYIRGLWKLKPVIFVWLSVAMFCIPFSTDRKLYKIFLLYDNHMRGTDVVMAVSSGDAAEIFCAHVTVSAV
jgi:hypothetical protein